MPTPLKNPLHRVSNDTLDGSFGPDRNKRVVITLIPGKDGVDDLIQLRPERSRRPETIAVIDVYRYAMRCRVNRGQLEKARAKKERKAIRLAQQRQLRAEKRIKFIE